MSTGQSPFVARLYIHDHLYSPVVLIASYGTVLERYEYDAYGNCHILEPNFADDPNGQTNYENPYLFTGRRVDILDFGSLKIQYNRNRYYDYYTGRWLTHDPLGIVPGDTLVNTFGPKRQYMESSNLYQYSSDNPVGALDALGLACAPGTKLYYKRVWRRDFVEESYPTGTLRVVSKLISKGVAIGSCFARAGIRAVAGVIDFPSLDGATWMGTRICWHERIHMATCICRDCKWDCKNVLPPEKYKCTKWEKELVPDHPDFTENENRIREMMSESASAAPAPGCERTSKYTGPRCENDEACIMCTTKCWSICARR